VALKKKINVLGYENLTQQQQEAARKLLKGIYVENIMSQMRFLWSATIINPIVGTKALSDIDIDYTPPIQRAPKIPITHMLILIQHCPSRNLWPGRFFCQSKQKKLLMSSSSHWKKSILKRRIQTYF
jgi:hypothetical protein